MAVYVISGIGGVLFSCLVSPGTLGVGASTSLYGILGAMIMWIVLNWDALANNPNRTCVLIILIFLAVINIVIGLAAPNIDILGHFGGFFTGLLIGAGLATYADPVPPKTENLKRYICLAICAGWIGLGLILFYTVVDA
jgi:rhomboid protease GluP